MEYVITRASMRDVDPDYPPCSGAVLKKVLVTVHFPCYGIYTMAGAESYAKENSGEYSEWFKSGSNHRVEGIDVIKDGMVNVWVISIDNIIDFFNKTVNNRGVHEGLIIGDSDCESIPIKITIYDDYIE
jgi:hypothetical protein